MNAMTFDRKADRALVIAAGHVSASIPEALPSTVWAAALADPDGYQSNPHLYAFFDETEVDLIADIAAGGVATYRQLADGAAYHLPETHPTRQWIEARCTSTTDLFSDPWQLTTEEIAQLPSDLALADLQCGVALRPRPGHEPEYVRRQWRAGSIIGSTSILAAVAENGQAAADRIAQYLMSRDH